MELWLDCRGVDRVGGQAPPEGCDRRLYSSGSRGGAAASDSAVGTKSDLRFDDETGKIFNSDGGLVGVVYAGDAADAQARALSAIGSAEWVVLEARDGSVCVPAENLIAAGRQAGTRVAVAATTARQVAGLAGALQLGVDALVIPASMDAEDFQPLWAEALKAKEARQARPSEDGAPPRAGAAGGSQELGVGHVTAVEPVSGLADRVCLDLIQLLREGEGVLVGSSAKALVLVQAETAQTGLVPPRPFRINAGPVHAYVGLSGGRTKYLSEVEAGDEVLVIDASTMSSGSPPTCRHINVGRCKIEPRPVLCVRFSDGDRSGQLFLQQAETVRVLVCEGDTRNDWKPRAVTDLEPGDSILVRWAALGTHVGREIAASVTEK